METSTFFCQESGYGYEQAVRYSSFWVLRICNLAPVGAGNDIICVRLDKFHLI